MPALALGSYMASVPPATATLLKFRFGAFEQLPSHLHVAAGRTVFFFGDPATSLERGQRVVIEFSFNGSEQVATLHGLVLRRIQGTSHAGAWLEFADTRLAQHVGRGAHSIGRRTQRRLGCELMVELHLGTTPVAGRMVDVSLAGARVLGVKGILTKAIVGVRILGAEASLPSDLGRAEVVHAQASGELGLRFVRADPVARVASAKLYGALQQAWSKAPEILHLPLCCKDGVVLDPPLPPMLAPG